MVRPAVRLSVSFSLFGKIKWIEIIEIDIDDEGGFMDVSGNEVHDQSIKTTLEDTVLNLQDKQKVKFSGYFKAGKKSQNECLKAGVFDANPESFGLP